VPPEYFALVERYQDVKSWGLDYDPWTEAPAIYLDALKVIEYATNEINKDNPNATNRPKYMA